MSSVEADKFVIALRKGLEPGRAANVVGHLSLGLVAEAAQREGDWMERMKFADYQDADGVSHAPISTLGAIIVTGRPAWLRRLRSEVADREVLSLDFTDLMTIDTAAEQLHDMAGTAESDLNYLGVGLFGAAELIDPLTRKFSLYQ